MQTVYHINANKIDAGLINSIKDTYGDNPVVITVESGDFTTSGLKFFEDMEEIRKSLSHIKVPENINLSELANEVNL